MEKTRRRRAEMMRRGLRMAPEKVMRKRLCHLPPVRFSGFVFSLFNRIFYFL